MTILALATDRIDSWVCLASIVLPLVALAGLALWHLVRFLTRMVVKERRALRDSREPRPPHSAKSLADKPAPAGGAPIVLDLREAAEAKRLAAQIQDDPERLQRACAMLADSLAEMYLDLAERWLRKGEPQKAAATLQQLVRSCPGTRWAQTARERLRQLGAAENSS
jgi:hypothetical protein